MTEKETPNDKLLKELLADTEETHTLKIGKVTFKWRLIGALEQELAMAKLIKTLTREQQDAITEYNKLSISERVDKDFPIEEIGRKNKYYIYSAMLISPNLSPEDLMRLKPKYQQLLVEMDKTLEIGSTINIDEEKK